MPPHAEPRGWPAGIRRPLKEDNRLSWPTRGPMASSRSTPLDSPRAARKPGQAGRRRREPSPRVGRESAAFVEWVSARLSTKQPGPTLTVSAPCVLEPACCGGLPADRPLAAALAASPDPENAPNSGWSTTAGARGWHHRPDHRPLEPANAADPTQLQGNMPAGPEWVEGNGRVAPSRRRPGQPLADPADLLRWRPARAAGGERGAAASRRRLNRRGPEIYAAVDLPGRRSTRSGAGAAPGNWRSRGATCSPSRGPCRRGAKPPMALRRGHATGWRRNSACCRSIRPSRRLARLAAAGT